jgi:CheY-like chemotaxis protein
VPERVDGRAVAADTRLERPVAPRPADELTVPAADAPGAPATGGDHAFRADAAIVLVVEDSPVNRIVAGRVLERAGFRAQLVDDALQALEALDAQNFDAVLMDCQMPGMDGYEATRELRRRESGGERRTPVIAMTAHAMTGDRERCLAAGMDDYIAKPVRSRTLVEVLRRWVPDTLENERSSIDAPHAESPDGEASSVEGQDGEVRYHEPPALTTR